MLVQSVFIYDIVAECWTCLSLSSNHQDSRTWLKKRKYLISNRKIFPPVTQNFAVPVVPSSTRSILGKLFRFPVLNVADIPLEKSRTQELNLKQTFPPEGWLLSAVQGFPISSHVMLSQKRVNSVKAQCTCRKFCLGLSSHKFLLLYHFIGVSPCKQCKQCNIHL